jgi:hypothetical protein
MAARGQFFPMGEPRNDVPGYGAGGDWYRPVVELLVIVIGVVATIAVVTWFIVPRQHPDDASSHHDPTTRTTSDQLYRGADRPAGPDAEVMDPDRLGGDQHSPE